MSVQAWNRSAEKRHFFSGTMRLAASVLALTLSTAASRAQTDEYVVQPDDPAAQAIICNRSSAPQVSYAKVYYDYQEEAYVVRGWYQLDRGACDTWTISLDDNLRTNFYYYARAADGRTWPDQSRGDALGVCISNDRYYRVNSVGYLCKRGETVRKFRAKLIERGTIERVNLVD